MEYRHLLPLKRRRRPGFFPMTLICIAAAHGWGCTENDMPPSASYELLDQDDPYQGDGDHEFSSDVDTQFHEDDGSDTAVSNNGENTNDDDDFDFDFSNFEPSQDEKLSYIWIANTMEGTLSKVDTVTRKELGRYFTGPQQSRGDPSRTSVNLHGDMAVTNRNPIGGSSSVTKFAAHTDDCVDRDNNGTIDTSNGPNDVKPWGQDECMIWNTPLANHTNARATAWDGLEDPSTGQGGHIFVGTTISNTVFKLDGETGEIIQQKKLPMGAYGGAMDGRNGFWIVDMGCISPACRIGRVHTDTLDTQTYNVACGYGISVDSSGRVWTAGMGCVSRFDPASKERKVINGALSFHRGIAVDGEGSVWTVETSGVLVRIDEEDVKVIKRTQVGLPSLIGVAVDYEGYVWTVSQGANTAYKLDPDTYKYQGVKIGLGPYTYSDMTGIQLRGVRPNIE